MINFVKQIIVRFCVKRSILNRSKMKEGEKLTFRSTRHPGEWCSDCTGSYILPFAELTPLSFPSSKANKVNKLLFSFSPQCLFLHVELNLSSCIVILTTADEVFLSPFLPSSRHLTHCHQLRSWWLNNAIESIYWTDLRCTETSKKKCKFLNFKIGLTD